MIELKNITKDYLSGENTVHALKGVSVAFRKSEFTAILGPSGGGKTTLLNIIGGLDHYTTGDLVINGKSTVNFKDRDWDSYRNHSVGFVFQSYNLIPHQSVVANVELALTISGVSKSERTARAKKALDQVGLSDQYYKKPNQLSGGQMQRVAIARALVNDPDILLADEPTGALDTENSIQIMELLKKVAQNRLVVMVTHNPELAEEYATRIIRIKDGQLLSDTNPFVPEISELGDFKYNRTSMSILTSLGLSLNNLMTKKARTLLTAFAGSIGIIGIALILALSTGVNNYIADVQRDSLSSYPLTLESSSADMTSLMTAMMGEITSYETEENAITEVQVIQSVFNNIGTNNLKDFKAYLESHYDEVQDILSDVQYRYGINLYIYSADTGKGLRQLNPSMYASRMNSFYSLSSYSFADTFQEIISNQQLLDEQYNILQGRWPEKYDEVVLIVSDANAVTDYMAYALGFRDPAELMDYMTSAMTGEKQQLDNIPMRWTYDELLDLTFKLVLPSDFYKYNADQKVWEDMSDDDTYVTKLVNNGMDLKVVGIVMPKSGSAGTAMNDGVGYTHDLIEYVIEQCSTKEIVKQQLQNQAINVINGKPFDEDEDSTRDSLDFGDMITIDNSAFERAIGFNLDQQALQQLITQYITQATNGISADSSTAMADLTIALTSLSTDMFNSYIEEKGVNGMATFGQDDINVIVADYMATQTSLNTLNGLAEKYGVPASMFTQVFSPLLNGALTGYYQMFTSTTGMESAVLSSDAVEPYLSAYISNESVLEGLQQMATALCEAAMKTTVASVMANMSTDLITSVASSLNVNADALADVFQFDMDEDEMSRILSSYLGTDSTVNDAKGNLRKFGYSDLDDPSMIALYFKDFDGKDAFKSWLSDYNDMVAEEDQINYTDLTGILMSSVSTIVNAVSYVLIAFVSVSLIVSSIMIGIITYISVLERTKEIGVLRSLGASKRNVANVFNAETFIIGLTSGAIGIGLTLLLCIPINIIIRKATNIQSIAAVLPTAGGIILIIISVVLTIIAGLIPAGFASKSDPVTALRSE